MRGLLVHSERIGVARTAYLITDICFTGRSLRTRIAHRLGRIITQRQIRIFNQRRNLRSLGSFSNRRAVQRMKLPSGALTLNVESSLTKPSSFTCRATRAGPLPCFRPSPEESRFLPPVFGVKQHLDRQIQMGHHLFGVFQ